MDSDTTISQMKELVEEFVQERDWSKFHTPKILSMAISIEASELMDLFKWYTDTQSVELLTQSETKEMAADEIADVMILCFAFANRADIDVSDAIRKKSYMNEKNTP